MEGAAAPAALASRKKCTCCQCNFNRVNDSKYETYFGYRKRKEHNATHKECLNYCKVDRKYSGYVTDNKIRCFCETKCGGQAGEGVVSSKKTVKRHKAEDLKRGTNYYYYNYYNYYN